MPFGGRVLACQAPNCGKKLRSDNREGYCRSHKSATSRLPARTCAEDGCGAALRAVNKSGYCSGHAGQAPNAQRLNRERNERLRQATAEARKSRPQCSFAGCTNLLHSDNASGRCTAHSYLADRPECSIPGCPRLLIATNKTGRCQDHSALLWVAKVCAEDGCDRTLRAHNLLGFCKEHTNGYSRNYALQRLYGLTAEQYDAMLVAQDGVCALCGNPPKPGGAFAASRLHVDHDHETGRVRALLCLNCNRGLGSFVDSPRLLRLAADYLDHHAAAAAAA